MRIPAVLMSAGYLAAALMTSSARADTDASGATVIPAARDVAWQPGPQDFPKSVKYAVLYGDPAKDGPFAIRVMMPPHTLFPLHTHSMDEMLTVVSGSFVHYIGPDMQHASARTMGAGGFVVLPKGVAHALETRNASMVAEVVGRGPFGMTYVNATHMPPTGH
ncbi:hypothetical protein AA103196_0284 [Ameyamaea chiangmaiensis NBRC 103196]|uniref:Cupin domain-containing protein n=1 Tax=Ameyamaea chiangmaiensis TaxID=442969 RepID=A0A850PHD7_9PROT|nr:cupin domain-containing protein [Ameyamaea chiangmaiensis]MBS4074681.1 cupin domain-containing protein [Ameyamaea chiangmaiensis]NVN42059.1 cupin domain-containing protein [Ameyamaea chiangmaiensis]GBQ62347.1 hypothetical protein AA103196_0284 [Ameyamaea chiangmaiensis NBRC 103196]